MDIETLLSELKAATEATQAENLHLRALLAAFAEPARAVLEAVDRFADGTPAKPAAARARPQADPDAQPPSRRRFSDDDASHWMTLMVGGMTVPEVSREIGVSGTTIRTRVRALGAVIENGRLVSVAGAAPKRWGVVPTAAEEPDAGAVPFPSPSQDLSSRPNGAGPAASS